MTENQELQEFVTLVRFVDVSPATMEANHGQALHDEYMQEFGALGVLTMAAMRLLGGDWHFIVRHKATEQSSAWFDNRIQEMARSEDGDAVILSLQVSKDITELF